MPRVYVALDLEFTGLNPEHDAILEKDGYALDAAGSVLSGSIDYRGSVRRSITP